MKKLNITLLSSLLAFSALSAKEFDFEDPKGVNNIRFNLDAPLEAIAGTGSGITGTINFDIDHPENISGEIILQTESLNVPNPVMRDHLHGENWLDAAQNPRIIFTAKSIGHIERNENTIEAHVTGTLLLKGTTQEITIPVTFTYLPDRLGERSNGQMEGDLLVVRSRFSVMRDDFGIMAGQAEDKVANEIEISMAIAGAAPDA